MNRHKALGFLSLIILITNAISTFFLVGILESNRPFAGGYNREILYVKDLSGNSSGFFIMVDDIERSNPVPVDMVLHGIGNLSINDTARECKWVTSGGKGLVARILYPSNVTITSHLGYYDEVEDLIPYVKIRPQLDAERVITFLFPFNDTIQIPEIEEKTTMDSSMTTLVVGDGEFFFHHDPWTNSYQSIADQGVTFSGDYMFCRKNATGDVVDLFCNDARFLQVAGTTYLELPHGQSMSISVTDGECVTNATLSTDYNVLKPQSWKINKQDVDAIIHDQAHPFLFFNESFKPTILDRIYNHDPWKSWFTKLKSQLPDVSGGVNLSAYSETGRSGTALKLAFVAYMEKNQTLWDAAKTFLLHMDEVEDNYEKHLTRSYCVSDYAFTFDLIYNNLSSSEISQIKAKLYAHARPLYDDMNHSAANNWRVVMSDGLAMAGFMLENVDFVWLSDYQIDWYLDRCTRFEGGSFEGQNYAGYTWTYGLRVCELLRHHGLRNYFQDPRLVATINFSIQTITPNGYYPLFEDCAYSKSINNINGIYAGRMQDGGYAELAGHMRWMNTFHSDFFKGFYGVHPIIFYDYNVSVIEPVIGVNGSLVFPDSGLACFRDEIDHSGTYITINCKHYDQSHVHEDENSFELFALGEKILTNPGYPGWGGPYHMNWTIKTEASNTYLFDGSGQAQETATGIREWLLVDRFNYISCDGLRLYSLDVA